MHVNYPTQEVFNPNHDARILILEDNVREASFLQRQLGEIGYKSTQIMHNSADFRKAVTMSDYDLFLIDILLEEPQTGLDLTEELSLQEKAPVIVLSNSDDERFINQAANLKTAAYMLKGLSNKQLNATITHALSHYDHQLTSPIGSKNWRIRKDDIVCVSASGYITTIHLAQDERDISLCGGFQKIVENQINYKKLIRIHTSFYVNLDYVSSYTANRISIPRKIKRTNANGIIKVYNQLPIGDTYKKNVHNRLTAYRK